MPLLKLAERTNHESVALNFAGIPATAGVAVANNTCGSSLAAGASCAVGVTFSPTAVGSATGTLTLPNDAGNSPQTVSLTGTGSAQVTLSSATLSFGTVTVGKSSPPKAVTLTNHGSASLAITGIAATAGFAVASNSCVTSVATGASCTVGVLFSPAAAGAVTGTLTFADNAITGPQSVGLTATGK